MATPAQGSPDASDQFLDAADNVDQGGTSDSPPPANHTPLATKRLTGVGFQIAVPDLRNGALATIQQAAPKASMSAIYSYPVIAALPHDRAIDGVEYMIRASFAQAMHILGADVTDLQRSDVRSNAIVIGSIRAGAIAAYRLGPGDVTRQELCSSGMRFDATSDTIGQDARGTTSIGRWTAAQAMDDLTDIDKEVIGVCVYMGMAIPVLQGASLVASGHHYIPPTYNLFGGIKRQALGQASQAARQWIETRGEVFNDMAFHKACHPISPLLKRSLAKSVDLATRLLASGHGSAAIRLPATPSEASGGKAALALLKSAAPLIRQMGHQISWDTGAQLMLDLDEAAEGEPEAAACDKIVKWVQDNAGALAFCAGIVGHMHDTTGSGKNTILAAYSIKRIIADNPSDVARGAGYARTAQQMYRDALAEGTVTIDAIAL